MRYISVKGFSLIELMIALAIVAIIAVVGLPSYRSHVCKVERNQAKADLMAFAQALERQYTTNNFRYLNGDGSAPQVFPLYSPSSSSAAQKKFTLTLAIPTGDGAYTVSASRAGGSCGDGEMALTSSGVRSWLRNGVTKNNWDE